MRPVRAAASRASRDRRGSPIGGGVSRTGGRVREEVAVETGAVRTGSGAVMPMTSRPHTVGAPVGDPGVGTVTDIDVGDLNVGDANRIDVDRMVAGASAGGIHGGSVHRTTPHGCRSGWIVRTCVRTSSSKPGPRGSVNADPGPTGWPDEMDERARAGDARRRITPDGAVDEPLPTHIRDPVAAQRSALSFHDHLWVILNNSRGIPCANPAPPRPEPWVGGRLFHRPVRPRFPGGRPRPPSPGSDRHCGDAGRWPPRPPTPWRSRPMPTSRPPPRAGTSP